MKKLTSNFVMIIMIALLPLVLTGCFSEKDSVFYDSEWFNENYDANGQLYYHDLILQPNHVATLEVMYDKTSNGIVWTGKYKINSKKIVFDFTDAVRYENGEVAEQITSGKVIKYYTGEFFYSVGEIEIFNNGTIQSDAEKEYHLDLIRPKNYFYGGNKDILGNQMEEFVKIK
ncbi:MAG: hypothetical protein K6G52_00790 [Treponemataceae bacterium]|nr:hypothetical protein [Treponemataceae bacterium]